MVKSLKNMAVQRSTLLVVAIVALGAAACGDPDPVETPVDSGTDADADGGSPDAQSDGGADTSVDTDAGSDGGEDTAPDVQTDGGADTGADTAPDVDGGADADVVDPPTCEERCADLARCASADPGCAGVVPSIGAACIAHCDQSDASFAAIEAGDCAEAVALFAFAAGRGDACHTVECVRPASDYTPAADDDWAACVSDGGQWVNIDPSVSTIARTAAYEQIADLLWRAASTPDAEAFISARTVYSTDEGIQSRVTRREDEHYAPVVDGDGNVLQCRNAGVPELDPDRCVGPALLEPVILDAFQLGIAGTSPLIQTRRIEAALTWFFYISTHKEATTCASTARDCDSSWAYYNGGTQRGAGIGLSAQIRSVSELADDRVFDGLLAVRCWRDLDNAATAADLEMQARAVAQLDHAALHGVARLVADRLLTLEDLDGDARAGAWAYVQIVGGYLRRAADAVDAERAASLDALAADSPDGVDAWALASDLLVLFACP